MITSERLAEHVSMGIQTIEYDYPRQVVKINQEYNLDVQEAGRVFIKILKLTWVPINRYMSYINEYFPGEDSYTLESGSISVEVVEGTNLVNVSAKGKKTSN